MKRLLAVFLLLSMLLAACAPASDTPDTTGDPSQTTDDPAGTNDPNVQEVTVYSRDGFSTTIQIVSGQIIFNDAIFEYFRAGNAGSLQFEYDAAHYSLESFPMCDLYLLLVWEGFNAFLVDTKTKEILDPLASMGEDVQGRFSGMGVSPDGKYALVNYRSGTILELLELKTGSRTKMPYEEGLYGVSGRFLDNETVLITSAYEDLERKISYGLSKYNILTGESTEIPGRFVAKDPYANNFMAMTEGPFAYTFTDNQLTLIDLRTMERTMFSLGIKEVTEVSHCTADSVFVRSGKAQYILKMDGSMQLVLKDSLEDFDALFGNMNSWYNRALTSQYADPKQVNLELLFYNGFSDESSKPTDAEWEELKDKPGFDINYDLERLPAGKMNQILTQYLGITLVDVETTGFYGLVYLERTNCYYRMGTDAEVVENFKATAVEALANGTIRLSYTSGYENTAYVATLKPAGDGYQILSNLRADNTGEDPRLVTFDSLFGNTDYWYNKALTSLYTDISKVNLKRLFHDGFPLEDRWLTEQEREELEGYSQIGKHGEQVRLPADKVNAVLAQLFGITLEGVDPTGFGDLVYLESTNCYYQTPHSLETVKNFKARRLECMEDGTVHLYYTVNFRTTEYDESRMCVAVLKLVDGQWQILSNQREDHTAEDPRVEKLEKLFGDWKSWYSQALTSLYTEPSQVNLKRLFYRGFSDESGKLTDAEKEALQGKVTLELDVRRLPVEKMNEVLSRYLGVAVEELDASSFKGLVYLESTDCYYFSTGDTEILENFKATRVEELADGTVRLYYTARSYATDYAEAACVATLKLVNGQWQILSNQKA